jgi:hypothetical protein
MNTGNAYQPGDRVVFGGFGHFDPSDLRSGTEGTVKLTGHNSIQGNWVAVDWDNGSSLTMLLDDGDRISRARG